MIGGRNMSFRRPSVFKDLLRIVLAWILVVNLAPAAIAAGNVEFQVLLTSPTSPREGQAGVGTIDVTGSGFPSGTILPADVTITLKPFPPGLPSATTGATAVTSVGGSMRRVSFTIPLSIVVSDPADYGVSLAGRTTDKKSFASSNTATLTVLPPARILSVSPNIGQDGETVPATITGQYTSFVQGSTLASFGPGISVGGAPEGAPGLVTVNSAITATAQVIIGATAPTGPRSVSVQTGQQQASLTNGFGVIMPPPPRITDFNPKSATIGGIVTVTGYNFVAPSTDVGPQVTLNEDRWRDAGYAFGRFYRHQH